jgi:hypothetical protein
VTPRKAVILSRAEHLRTLVATSGCLRSGKAKTAFDPQADLMGLAIDPRPVSRLVGEIPPNFSEGMAWVAVGVWYQHRELMGTIRCSPFDAPHSMLPIRCSPFDAPRGNARRRDPDARWTVRPCHRLQIESESGGIGQLLWTRTAGTKRTGRGRPWRAKALESAVGVSLTCPQFPSPLQRNGSSTKRYTLTH